jgi:glycosyltransferase involved in cell wall biosynthesis
VTVFHDLQHKRHPEHFRWYDLPFWRILLYGSSRVSRLLLADSEATRRDLLRFYTVPSSRIRVVPLGVDPEFFQLERRPEKFLLTVSTLHPHKNVDRLLRVFATFSRQQPDFRLVIAGLRGFAAEQLDKTRSELGLTQAVEFTGWLPREELYSLYGRAWAFVYPSTFEGFGLPVVEAMAAAIPVACSRIDPLAEICADAAVLFDPGSESEMLSAFYAVINDAQTRSRLSVDGPARAAHFSWRQTAQLTHAALIEAARQA